MDRLTEIEVFVAAIDEGSLVAAGKRFGLSASMAGKYLSSLEASLNVRLIQRSTRKLNATDAGRAYYERCKRILEEFDEANRETSDKSTALRGLLRVTAPVSFGMLHLSDLTARFMAEHPQIAIDITRDDRYVDLHASGIDIAIRIGRLADSELVAKRLAPCRMVLCAAPAFLEQYESPPTPDDLKKAPRLDFSEVVTSGGWNFIDSERRQYRIDGPTRMLSNNMHMLLAAALAGAGIAYGPTFVFGEYLASGKLVRLLPDLETIELTVHAVFPSARYLPSKVRQFIDYLATEWADGPSWDRH